MTYKIKTAREQDIRLMLDWAKAEGWNPGIYDHIPFRAADPNGFFIGWMDNIPIASISAVNYQNQFGFIGFYIVKPEFRGQGLGFKIWQHGMEYLAKVHTIGLDGVVAEQEIYKKSGFSLAHRNRRYSGSAPDKKNTAQLIDLHNIPLTNILEYEEQLFPCRRAEFLKLWIKHAEIALAYIENNKIQGYGVLRKCVKGYKIGPLFAENYDIAEQIFLGLCSKIQGEQIAFDPSELNQDGIRLAEQYHFKMIFETARMYTNTHPDLDLSKIFGITSCELG